MDDKLPITIERLSRLEPISSLSEERLQELVSLSYVEQLPLGMSVFREGDVDNQTIYLLKGDVQLTSSDGSIDKVLAHKDDAAKFPVDDSQPRRLSCVALSRVEIVRIDNSVLDYMMMWDQMAASEELEPQAKESESGAEADEADMDTESDADTATAESVAPAQSVPADENRSWIRKMRHIMAFKNMPPANIKALLERMETILVNEGDVVVRQGDAGDYYYVLTEGNAEVTRTVELAQLKPGASFGEEALVADTKRNATVTMTSNGMLMRLSKDDFNELLKEPLINRVGPEEARQRVNKGAVWLDVRHAKEYHHSHLPKAVNIPLHEVRMRMAELDKNKHYIVYCGTGRRSSAAAFLLVQRGYQASVLNGGIQVMAQDLER